MGDADFIYHGRLELAGDKRVKGRAYYRFTAAAAFGSDRLITLREPVIDVPDLQPTYRVDTAWVRDPMRDPAGTDHYSETQFTADIETGVYEGILKDPVYRWRDDQLGFYLYSDPGFTSSYYSGFDTRCGQNPWPAEAAFRGVLDKMTTVGVLLSSDPSGRRCVLTSDALREDISDARQCARSGGRPSRSGGGVAETGEKQSTSWPRGFGLVMNTRNQPTRVELRPRPHLG